MESGGLGGSRDTGIGDPEGRADVLGKEKDLQDLAERDIDLSRELGRVQAPVEKSLLERAFDSFMNNRVIRDILNSTPVGAVPGLVMDLVELASLKARGFSDEEIDKIGGRMMIGRVAPGFGPAAALGRGLQSFSHNVLGIDKSVKASGFTPGGQADAREVSPETAFDRSNIDLAAARLAAVRRRNEFYG